MIGAGRRAAQSFHTHVIIAANGRFSRAIAHACLLLLVTPGAAEQE